MVVSLKNWWMKPARGSRVALFAFFYPLVTITIIQFLNNIVELQTGLSSRENNALIAMLVYLPPLVSFWRLDLKWPKILNVPIIGLFYLPVMLWVSFLYEVTTNIYIYMVRTSIFKNFPNLPWFNPNCLLRKTCYES